MEANGQSKDTKGLKPNEKRAAIEDFVLDKSIFSNIFEKDIKRVYIYKKSERLAKAIHLVGPAFYASPALRDRLDKVAVGLVDAATESPMSARTKLSRELLALSSVLSIARTSGLLSAMNAELIAREAQSLLQEVASYEEPRLFLEAAPTLAELARDVASSERMHQVSPYTHDLGGLAGMDEETSEILRPQRSNRQASSSRTSSQNTTHPQRQSQGQVAPKKTERQDAIISILKNKGTLYIKDISTVILDVSEKTIQRELLDLVNKGFVTKEGGRRWTTYTLVS